MPQLNPHDFAPQLTWLAIVFVFLCLFLARVALPRINRVLEQRRNAIDNDLDKARQFREESETVISEYETVLAEARASAQGTAAETREKIAAKATKEEAKAQDEIDAKMAEAEAGIAKMRDAAMSNLDIIARDAAEQIVTGLTGNAQNDAVAKAVSAVLKA